MSGTQPGEPIRCLVFSASLRAASFNTVLARLAAGEIEARGGRVDLAAIKDFDSPSYDQDVQFESGFPRVEGRQHRGPDGQVGERPLCGGARRGVGRRAPSRTASSRCRSSARMTRPSWASSAARPGPAAWSPSSCRRNQHLLDGDEPVVQGPSPQVGQVVGQRRRQAAASGRRSRATFFSCASEHVADRGRGGRSQPGGHTCRPLVLLLVGPGQ